MSGLAVDGAARTEAVNPWIVAVAVMSATFMEVLDTTVVNVSLPHIAGDLSATIDESTWALTSYLAANAVILPLAGWLANHFGRKRLMTWSVLTFTAASLLCGLAPTLPILVIFRVIQGLTGGVMMPLSQSVMLEGFPPHERGRAMGLPASSVPRPWKALATPSVAISAIAGLLLLVGLLLASELAGGAWDGLARGWVEGRGHV